MLTLGLWEGLAFASLLALIFAMLADGAPMHRILGPPALIALSLISIGVVNADLTLTATQIGGLIAAGVVGFLVPVAVMRSAWRSSRQISEAPATETPTLKARPGAIVIAHPMRHHRLHRRSHRHAA